MPTKFIFFFFMFLLSCGKDVKFTDHLAETSALAQPMAISQVAIIIKNSANPPGKIIMGGKTYSISPFSSYVALNFVSAQAEGAQVQVKIRGEVKGTEVYIKVIEQ